MAIGLDLDQYQLKNRVLLIFAPDPRDARYREQRDYLHDDSDELQEQRLVVFGIFDEGPSFAEERPLSREDSARAREHFGVHEDEFALHLIGLDGRQVLSSGVPLPADRLLAMMD